MRGQAERLRDSGRAPARVSELRQQPNSRGAEFEPKRKCRSGYKYRKVLFTFQRCRCRGPVRLNRLYTPRRTRPHVPRGEATRNEGSYRRGPPILGEKRKIPGITRNFNGRTSRDSRDRSAFVFDESRAPIERVQFQAEGRRYAPFRRGADQEARCIGCVSDNASSDRSYSCFKVVGKRNARLQSPTKTLRACGGS